ncbi:TPA: DUF551 domain-containing protein [Salmonella enterica subsp. enterica serovar Virchow]
MTITKERLLKIQHWRETYGADSNVMLPAEEAEELARIALASLDADQPVPEEIPKGLAGQIVGLLAHNIGDKLLAQKIWNACRAAMLLANQRDLSQPVDPQVAEYEQIMLQAGSSPVIPDGWISCSERMPDDEQEVIVHNKLGYRYVSYFDEHSGLFFDMRGGNQMNCTEHILVTHWMPLPEPPQEVK